MDFASVFYQGYFCSVNLPAPFHLAGMWFFASMIDADVCIAGVLAGERHIAPLLGTGIRFFSAVEHGDMFFVGIVRLEGVFAAFFPADERFLPVHRGDVAPEDGY